MCVCVLALGYQFEPALLSCHVGPAVDSDAVQTSQRRQTQARPIQPSADPQDGSFPPGLVQSPASENVPEVFPESRE